MKIEIYSLKPYFDVDGYFTNIPDKPTFDPKHPCIYPGVEVVPVETLPAKVAQQKYGRYINRPYQVHNSGNTEKCTVTIFRYTGKTSKDIILENR
jgi:hypothetical protein